MDKRFESLIQEIAREEHVSPNAVRSAVTAVMGRLPNSPTRRNYMQAKGLLKQQIQQAQRNLMPQSHTVIHMRVLRISQGGSAEGETGSGVSIVLPHGQQRRKHRVGETIPVVVINHTKNAIIVSEQHHLLMARLFTECAPRGTEMRAFTRITNGATVIAAVSNSSEDRDQTARALSDLLREEVQIVPWSDDRETFLRTVLAPAHFDRVAVEGHNAIVYAENPAEVIGLHGARVNLAARLTGMHIQVRNSRKVSVLAEAVGVVR